ncbi:MAG: NUDIX hydrolase [Pseudomonadota bacterium]
MDQDAAEEGPFIGAKVALFIGARLLVILRDEDRDIPWPGWWDFPGGGREGAETPEAVAIRETREEVGLALDPGAFVWKRRYLTSTREGTYFFVQRLPAGAEAGVMFGGEGQRWELWHPEAYLAHPRGIPHFKQRLRTYLHHHLAS